MGILQNVKNFVTGSAADVVVEIKQRVLNDSSPLQVHVKVTAKADTVFPKEVYLNIEAEERSANRKTIYSDKQILDKNIQLNAGESKEWDAAVEIPATVPGTFIGKHSSLKWSIHAGIDMSGVDPSSDKVSFVVNRPTAFELS